MNYPHPVPAASVPAVLDRPCRVLVVDDHAPTREAVSALLAREYPSMEVVGSAGDGRSALRLVDAAGPDVVVLDLDLGGEYGLDLMPAIRRPGTAVVILTASDDPMERRRAMAAGAVAFVSKLAPVGELLDAIRHASARQTA